MLHYMIPIVDLFLITYISQGAPSINSTFGDIIFTLPIFFNPTTDAIFAL